MNRIILGPFILIQSNSEKLLTLVLGQLAQVYFFEYSLLIVTILIEPTIKVFLTIQKYFVVVL